MHKVKKHIAAGIAVMCLAAVLIWAGNKTRDNVSEMAAAKQERGSIMLGIPAAFVPDVVRVTNARDLKVEGSTWDAGIPETLIPMALRNEGKLFMRIMPLDNNICREDPRIFVNEVCFHYVFYPDKGT